MKSYSESVNFAVSKSVRRGLSEQTYLMYIPILIFIHGYSLKHMLHFHYINYFIIMCRSCSSSLLFLIKKICVSMYGVPFVSEFHKKKMEWHWYIYSCRYIYIYSIIHIFTVVFPIMRCVRCSVIFQRLIKHHWLGKKQH